LLPFLTLKTIKILSSKPGNNIVQETNISEKWKSVVTNTIKPELSKFV
jgi:hypothetical protein